MFFLIFLEIMYLNMDRNIAPVGAAVRGVLGNGDHFAHRTQYANGCACETLCSLSIGPS